MSAGFVQGPVPCRVTTVLLPPMPANEGWEPPGPCALPVAELHVPAHGREHGAPNRVVMKDPWLEVVVAVLVMEVVLLVVPEVELVVGARTTPRSATSSP